MKKMSFKYKIRRRLLGVQKYTKVARFFMQYTKTEKIYQLTTTLPSVFQRAINEPPFFVTGPSKIYPNLDIWFENIPSGNAEINSFSEVGESVAEACRASAAQKNKKVQ
jgi:hypothetical protein